MFALLEAMRTYQWVKNLLVFAPLVFSKRLFEPESAMRAAAAFAAFCMVASAIYLFNDLFDLERDREHPKKKNRPLASGRLSVGLARVAFVVLAAAGITIGVLAPGQFFVPLCIYFALNIAYSMHLKHVAILDTMCIAIGFVLRVYTGGLAIEQQVSGWLALCTFFIALMLAFCKRRHEIALLGESKGSHRKALEDYSLHFLDQLIAPLGALTVTTYALYTVAPQTVAKFGTDKLILTVPFVVYGVFRYLWLVHMRQEGGNPTALLMRDVPMLINVFAWGGVALWAVLQRVDLVKHERAVALLAVVAFVLRFGLALRVGVSSNDGAIYLWASEAVARGDFGDGFGTVFHAGTALLVAPFIFVGLPSLIAAGLAMSLAAVVTVYLLERIARELGVGEGARLIAVALFVCGFHFVRLPADVYSESFSVPIFAASVLCACRRRFVWGAVFAGLAYWVRPEAAVSVLVVVVASFAAHRSFLRAAGYFALAVVVAHTYTLLYLLQPEAWPFFAFTPKLEFMAPLGPIAGVLNGDYALALSRFVDNAMRLPRAMVSGLDYVVFFIGLAGFGWLWHHVRWAAWAFAAVLIAHVSVLLAFQVKPRFFLSLAPVVFPLVACAVESRRYWRWLAVLALVVALVRVGKDFVDPPRVDKLVEIEIGLELAREVEGDGALVSGLPRVMWAAGRRPLPPWPWTVEQLHANEHYSIASRRALVFRATPENREAMRKWLPQFTLRETRGRVDIFVRK